MFKKTNKHLTSLHIPFSHQIHQGHIMAVVFLLTLDKLCDWLDHDLDATQRNIRLGEEL